MDFDELKLIVKQAGTIAIAEQKKLITQTKKDGSIVSNGDLAVSSFLEKELKRIYPEWSFFSEEKTETLPTSEKVIIVDPIDGTESYVRGQNSWSILIGFLDKKNIVGGLIYQPTLDNLYFASKGEGAFLQQGRKIRKLDSNRMGPKVAVCSPKDYKEHDFLKNLIDEKREMYSAALKFMEVAKGVADIYPNFRQKCSWWDVIAPMIILEEAGGRTLFKKNLEITFDNPHVSTDILAIGPRFFGVNFWNQEES